MRGAEKIRLRLASIAMMLPKALEDGLGGSLKWDTDEVLGRLRCPVTLVTGDPALGAVMTPEEASRAASIVSGLNAVQVSGVGHLIHDQRPDAWLDAVNAWIGGVLDQSR